MLGGGLCLKEAKASNLERPARDKTELFEKFLTTQHKTAKEKEIIRLKNEKGETETFVKETELPYSELNIREFMTGNLTGNIQNELYLVHSYLNLSTIMQHISDQGDVDMSEAQKYFLQQAIILANTSKSKEGWLLKELQTTRGESTQKGYMYDNPQAPKKKRWGIF